MDESFPPKGFCLCRLLPLGISSQIMAEEGCESGTDNRRVSLPLDFPGSPPRVQDKSRSEFIPTTIKNLPPGPLPPQAHFPRRSTSNMSWMKRLHLLIQTSCRERGTFPGLIYVFLILPTHSLLISQFHAMMDGCTIETDPQEPHGHAIDTLLRNGPLRVPTFYSYTGHSLDRIAFGVSLSVIFGAMHCIAWHYEFSSSPERWGWRISSIIVSVMPLVPLLVFTAFRWMGITTPLSTRSSPIFHVLHVGIAWPYIISRIILLLFPLIALRALPPGAYAELDWTTMIPHI